MTDEKRPRSMLYKDITGPLNQAYNELLTFYSQGDYRVAYLRTFELTLSLACPDRMLWNYDCYRRLAAISPLPDEPRMKIAPGTFLNYLMVYEQIMREADLIDKEPMLPVQGDLELFDMGAERWRPRPSMSTWPVSSSPARCCSPADSRAAASRIPPSPSPRGW